MKVIFVKEIMAVVLHYVHMLCKSSLHSLRPNICLPELLVLHCYYFMPVVHLFLSGYPHKWKLGSIPNTHKFSKHIITNPCKNSQAVKKGMNSINIIAAISWLPPLISQLFSPRLFKAAPFFHSLAVFVWISNYKMAM